ncbi:MAG: PilT-like protein [Deltaproteobacteria bacterium]|nr:PilT-like protein [Deltaproteobacteria bacterium]MBP1716770.1 PilT-like protein [Deltaproteobacteria bacterium]
MNLDDIPLASVCVLDTNILLYAEQGISHQAQRLLRRCSAGDLSCILPQTAWQELSHRLMLAEAMMLGRVSGPNAARKLARQPELIKKLGLYRDKMQSLISLGIGFEPCLREDFFETAFRFQEKYGLLTNDSVILSTAVRIGADFLISSDMVFQQVSEIAVAMPSDVQL